LASGLGFSKALGVSWAITRLLFFTYWFYSTTRFPFHLIGPWQEIPTWFQGPLEKFGFWHHSKGPRAFPGKPGLGLKGFLKLPQLASN